MPALKFWLFRLIAPTPGIVPAQLNPFVEEILRSERQGVYTSQLFATDFVAGHGHAVLTVQLASLSPRQGKPVCFRPEIKWRVEFRVKWIEPIEEDMRFVGRCARA